ncbi:hypothetical protein Cci01nite_00630 [Catellatospora citrea]|uniref:Histidine kinase/HSP90-like ATPase domain-containing protein n=1 Tax=Catellatospora citrea TaxID=53366 RepID=A0A8J3KFI8_9ACTN|nr:anti-sigma regulatory factor (Ser/Thr protein kinase) [Catellatospora citrea]GIF94969.1 hypothetical protein Cci01nite_00630 [Catellatospora citrea]
MNPAARTRYGTPAGTAPYRRTRRNLLPPPAPPVTEHEEAAGHDVPTGPTPMTPHDQVLVEGPFTRVDLRRIRRRIHELGESWRLPESIGWALELVTTELVVNVVMHAEGQGRLRLSRYPGWVFCQVSDVGPGVSRPYTAGWQPPSGTQTSGRGLWIARCFSDRLTIDSSALGTTVTAKLWAPSGPR